MFASLFRQVGSVLVLYLPIRTIQDIIKSGLINDCDDLLTPSLRYHLYTNINQMQERVNQFIESREYFKSIPDHVTTYQLWNIILYDSFNDKERHHIKSLNILDVVSIKQILTFCLLPESEYFTTVQSKHDGLVQKINIWTKPQQLKDYMQEIMDTHNIIKYDAAKGKIDEIAWIRQEDPNELFQFKHAPTRTWKTVCHGVWDDACLDGLMNQTKHQKSQFRKAKYLDWKPDHIPSFDLEFCNFYYDDNDAIIGNYYPQLRDSLCVCDFVENGDGGVIKRWYAIDIETKGISTRLTIINSNVVCGLLKMDREIVMKKSNEQISNEMEMIQKTNKKNKNIKINSNDDEVKRHIVMYKFEFIVWKGRYKRKDEINAELDELDWMETHDVMT
eukprot:74204_1